MSPITNTSPPRLTNLIILCCHAIYIPSTHRSHIIPPNFQNTILEEDWLIAPFQTREPSTFITHLQQALHLTRTNPSSLLVISGSRTHQELKLSEASSYLYLAVENGFWEHSSGGEEESYTRESDAKERIVIEEKALDSFSNLIYSIIIFWRRTGRWPEKITIVSHAFKEKRFLDGHCETLGIPRERVSFVGVDPKYMDEKSVEFDKDRTESVRRGEEEKGYQAWAKDEWGRGELLREKRAARNFWNVEQCLFESEEERERSGIRSGVVRFEWEGRVVEEEVLIDGFRDVYSLFHED